MSDTPTLEALRQCRDALREAEAALADIGDADREPGDDVAWCEARAAEDLPAVRAALAAADAALSVQAEPVATVTECEACFTPDVCQLRGTCDHYAAERLRVAATTAPQPPAPVPAVPLDDEQMHEALGPAGPDLLELAKQWADNKIHVYQFTHQAERIVAEAIKRAHNITGGPDHG